MKRNQYLAFYSREHHGTLILSRLIQKGAPPYKGLPAATKEKAAYALEMFEGSIRQHFQSEEQLLSRLSERHPALEIWVSEITSEHRGLSAQFGQLKDARDLESKLDQLGQMLEGHIRKEERILFPLIEEICTDAELKEYLPIIKH
jgi:iron-sulfur cluster repair protein YtfE (RIC family)